MSESSKRYSDEYKKQIIDLYTTGTYVAQPHRRIWLSRVDNFQGEEVACETTKNDDFSTKRIFKVL